MKVSIIIPALNERDCLPASLAALKNQIGIHEIIVVDGGSTDGTLEWLLQQAEIKVIQAPRGTGFQLNAGAKLCTGNVLAFLHADTLLPENAHACLENVLAEPRVVGGCFAVRFDRRVPRSLGIVAGGINLRTLLTRSATGDQAIFVRRGVFQQIGGFREWPLFEDVDFVSRLKQAGRFGVIRSPVTVSARRHVRWGVLRTVMLCYLLRLGFWAGISPFTLAKWYQAERENAKSRITIASGNDRDADPKVETPVIPAAWAGRTLERLGGQAKSRGFPRVRRL